LPDTQTHLTAQEIRRWDLATLDKWIEANRPGGGDRSTPVTAAEWLKPTRKEVARKNNLFQLAVKIREKELPCRFWCIGACKFGEECRFGHPKRFGQPSNDFKDALIYALEHDKKGEGNQEPPATSPPKKKKIKRWWGGGSGEEDYHPERTRGSVRPAQTAQCAASWR